MGKNCRLPADLLSAYSGTVPPIFEDMDTNIVDTGEKKTDDVDEVFAKAPHTISQRMRSQRLAGVPMEVAGGSSRAGCGDGGHHLVGRVRRSRMAYARLWRRYCDCRRICCG